MAGTRLTLHGSPPLPVALGTVKLGRNHGVKYPESFALPSDREVEALLEGAFELGVRVFDTAPAYGDAEARLRDFVRRHRQDILLCTKAGEEFVDGVSRHDFSGAAIRASCERSLRRLGCDRLDLLFLHSDGGEVEALDDDELLETLDALRAEGKILRAGLSAKSEHGVRRATERLDAVMAPFGLHAPQLGPALRAAHDAGRTVFAIKTLASGYAVSGHGIEASLAHVFSQPFVDVSVVGTLQLAHLRQAVEAAKAGVR